MNTSLLSVYTQNLIDIGSSATFLEVIASNSSNHRRHIRYVLIDMPCLGVHGNLWVRLSRGSNESAHSHSHQVLLSVPASKSGTLGYGHVRQRKNTR